jgi:cell division protein FtsQ
MKSKRVLKTQAVKKKKGKALAGIWKALCLVGACFFKFSFLLVGLVMISLLFVSIYGYLLKSPYIRLERVLVTGVSREIKGELLDMSGLNHDLSLFAINLNKLKERLERHPWVRTVELEKRFPHTLVIRAEKERPWALVAMDKLYFMNRWGKVFQEANQAGELDYPIITGITLDESGRAKQLKRAVHVLSTLERGGDSLSLKDLSEVHVKEDGNVSLYFSSLPVAVTLRGTDLEERMVDLKKLVAHLNSTGRIRRVKGINLNYHDGAVVSMKTS